MHLMSSVIAVIASVHISEFLTASVLSFGHVVLLDERAKKETASQRNTVWCVCVCVCVCVVCVWVCVCVCVCVCACVLSNLVVIIQVW